MLNTLHSTTLSEVLKHLSNKDLARLRTTSNKVRSSVNNLATNRLNQEKKRMNLKRKRKTQINALINKQGARLTAYKKEFNTILKLPYTNNFYNQFVKSTNNYMTKEMNVRNLLIRYSAHLNKKSQ
jgi:division protein CdvB (Snf7/Vps24/ESCRT-III family)